MKTTNAKEAVAYNSQKNEERVGKTTNKKRNIGLLSKEDLIDLLKEQRSW